MLKMSNKYEVGDVAALFPAKSQSRSGKKLASLFEKFSKKSIKFYNEESEKSKTKKQMTLSVEPTAEVEMKADLLNGELKTKKKKRLSVEPIAKDEVKEELSVRELKIKKIKRYFDVETSEDEVKADLSLSEPKRKKQKTLSAEPTYKDQVKSKLLRKKRKIKKEKRLSVEPIAKDEVKEDLSLSESFDLQSSFNNITTSQSNESGTIWDKSKDFLSPEIWDFFQKNKQSRELYEQKKELRDRLQEILQRKFIDCNLYIVGSSQNFLGSSKSDLDLCLTLNVPKPQPKSYLYKMQHVFSQYAFIKKITVIPAKVPILRCYDATRDIEVDINVNNTIGIRNTQLLSTYASVDERLAPLVTVVKAWAKVNGINDAKNGTLSSYCIALMVINYLQFRCDPPVLPSLQQLQPDKYLKFTHDLKFPEELPDFKSKNQKNLGELFLGFLKYYAHEFKFYDYAISVRLGKVIPRKSLLKSLFTLGPAIQWKYLYIEEPFEKTNAARSITTADNFQYILDVFKLSHKTLRRNPALVAVLGLH